MKCRMIGSLGNASILFHKGIIELIKCLLLFCDELFWNIVSLICNELPDTVPQSNQPFDSSQSSGGYFHWIHTAVFTVVHFTIYNGIGEILDRGVGWNGSSGFCFTVLTLILPNGTIDLVNCRSKKVRKFLPFYGNTCSFFAIWTTDFFHLTQNHFWMFNKILVH